jgi:hypothetical protein
MIWERYREELWLDDTPEETIFECEKAWNASVRACMQKVMDNSDFWYGVYSRDLDLKQFLTDNEEVTKT